jgi:hypothetical protein
MKITFVENVVHNWDVSKSFQKKEKDFFNGATVQKKILPAFNFFDKQKKKCALSIKWQLIINGSMEYDHISHFMVNYSELENLNLEIDATILYTLTFFMKHFVDHFNLPNALKILEKNAEVDERMIHFVRNRIIQRFYEESSEKNGKNKNIQSNLNLN